eukprot:TRINITY_DN2439_c0_g1_i1.p1 TRINITY_DN2439_c0_g1~~TRINITY_DN2439_c0_g1_i1.p1  ORF type:complete len:607 (-),score=107.62 TRINITY_DN2439_c0_g1_i1:9-1829(-)
MTRRIESSFVHTRRFEDPALQNRIRALVPLKELEARSKSADASSPPGYDARDRLLLQILHWFKNSFFKWVNQPPCSMCGKDEANNMIPMGGSQPTPEELRWEAFMTEVYSCKSCGSITRFPRYNHPEKLLETRCGRCGEWANCFTALCRALGYEARHVIDWTDHVWTEVYSSSQKRWMHADSCEDKLDAPLMYESGWGKKLSYVLAFSAFEVVDVTKRYTRKWQEVLDRRSLVSEEWLEKKLDLMNQMVMSSLPPMVWDPMIQRKQLEQNELEETLFYDPSASEEKPEEQEGRISGSKEWKDSRGESGKPKPAIEDGTCAVPGRTSAHIPVASYQLADKTNLDAVLAKVKEFNASTTIPEKSKLSPADIEALASLSTTLRTSPPTTKIPSEQLAPVERSISSWPFPNLFPLLDISRISLLNTSAAEFWAGKMGIVAMRFLIFSSAAAAASATPEVASANAMMIMRFFSNALASSASRGSLSKFLVQIVDAALGVITRCSKNAKQSAAICIVNASKCIADSNDGSHAANIASKLLSHFKTMQVPAEDTEVLYCLIVAAGTLAEKFPAAKQAVREVAPSITGNVDSVKKLGIQKLQEAISEFENVTTT